MHREYASPSDCIWPIQICATVNENEGDAIQAYGGNKSAGLRVRKALREIEILCVDMRNALFDQPLRKTAGRKKKADGVEGAEPAGEGAKDGVDGQSDDGLEDFNEYYDREIDSDIECDVETRRPSSTPPSEPSNEVHEYQFLKKADADVGERSWPHGLQSLKPGMRMDLGGPRQAPPQMTPPAQGTPSVVLQHEEGKWPPAVVYLDRD